MGHCMGHRYRLTKGELGPGDRGAGHIEMATAGGTYR